MYDNLVFKEINLNYSLQNKRQLLSICFIQKQLSQKELYMETIQNINVENILLYTENPRHEVTLNQRETLDKLISKVGSSQMYNLLEDIYLNGLIGANLPVLVLIAK